MNAISEYKYKNKHLISFHLQKSLVRCFTFVKKKKSHYNIATTYCTLHCVKNWLAG